MYPTSLTRPATDADAAALRQLAALDSQRPLSGPVLLTEIAGRPAAALSLADGRVVADPFHHTAHLVTALRRRVGAMRAYEATPSLARRVRAGVAVA